MKFNIRRINENDWKTFEKWWKQWGFKDFPNKDFLPDNGTSGLIVEENNKPVVSTFIYTTNSKVAIFEWPLSDKSYNKKSKDQAIELLIKGVENVCKAHGFKYLQFFGDNKKYINKLKDLDFKEGDSGYSLITKTI
jgi:hypothetical protein